MTDSNPYHIPSDRTVDRNPAGRAGRNLSKPLSDGIGSCVSDWNCRVWARFAASANNRGFTSASTIVRNVHRRGLLQSLSVAAVAFGSGCLDFLAGPPRYLEAVYVRNDDDTDHRFGLTVEQNGEVVQETAIELDRSQGPVRVDCEWSGRGPFVVTCMLGGDQTETVQIAEIEEGAGEYADIRFIVTSLGELSVSGFLSDGGGRSCSESSSGS